MRKLFAVAGLAALAAPAAALMGMTAAAGSQPATISFSSPSANGATFSQGPVTLAGAVSAPSGYVSSVDVTVKWIDTASNRPPAPHPVQETTIQPPTQAPTYNWSFQLNPAANGQYQVTVSATTNPGDGSSPQQASAAETFIQDIAPATPVGLTETTDGAQRVVHLAWRANSEPDLIGYEIFRAGPASNATFSPLYGVYAPATTYTDNQVATQPPGTYRYEVAAVRPSGDGKRADVSPASNEADTTITTPAKAAPPPSPTTTTAPTSAKGAKPSSAAAGGSPSSSGSSIRLAPVQDGLPAYQQLLNQAQASTATTEPPDPGFNPNLPYQPSSSRQAISLPGIDGGALGSGQGTSGVHRTVEFVAAALVLAVLAMFTMVLRRSADQAEVLAALAPSMAVPLGLGAGGAAGPAAAGPAAAAGALVDLLEEAEPTLGMIQPPPPPAAVPSLAGVRPDRGVDPLPPMRLSFQSPARVPAIGRT